MTRTPSIANTSRAYRQELRLSDAPSIENARKRYRDFLKLCYLPSADARLTPAAEPSPYATCFWVFGMRLLRQDDELITLGEALALNIRHAVRAMRKNTDEDLLLTSKPYRQLLAFSLSALSILNKLDDDPLEDLVVEQLSYSVERELVSCGCLSGKAQSGNQAMFTAVFLLHAQKNLGLPVSVFLDDWIELHLNSMNQFGFWGKSRAMTALQFQNGYHQYEILEYLGVTVHDVMAPVEAVYHLADHEGHFAPYPGGGGCFDYDAVFMLTPNGEIPKLGIEDLLNRTFDTLLFEQQMDGGFCESMYVRPRSLRNGIRGLGHVLSVMPNMAAAIERMRYALALQRRKYDRIQTHWCAYARGWAESDLWDSWFRMLTLARIECAMNKEAESKWGFINFPGIGFHPSIHDKSRVES